MSNSVENSIENNVESTVENSVENNVEDNVERSVEHTPDESQQEQSSRSIFMGAKWFDAIVILLLAVLAQGLGGVIARAVGIAVGMGQVSDVMRESVNPEVVEYVEFLQSRYIALSLAFAIVIGFVVVAFYAYLRGWRNPLSFRVPGWASPFRLLCGYLLLWCVSIAVEPLAEILPGTQNTLGGGGWLIISAVLLAPLFEEVMFRGYIAGSLRSAYGGVVAWLFSSLLFGLMHAVPSIILTATCGGLVLGYYYLRHRSLVMVIILHAMNNLTACFLKTVEMDNVSVKELIGDNTTYWVVYGVSVVVTLVAFWRMTVAMTRIKSDKLEAK